MKINFIQPNFHDVTDNTITAVIEESFNEVVLRIIPIYTRRNPHPTRKRKADCPIEVQYKQGLRQSMLIELKLGCDRQTVIEKYKRKVEQL